MNITQEMNNWEQHQIEQYIKRQVKAYVREATNDEFFDAYYDGDPADLIDKHNIFGSTAIKFNLPSDEMYQARLDATIDQLLEGDWLTSFVEEEADGRRGEVDKQQTDQAAFNTEKSRVANKYD